MTLWLAGMLVTADRLNDYTPDSETTTGLVAATDFSVNDFYGVRSKGTVTLDMYLEYTGADIANSGTAGQEGNITDTAACTAPAGWRPNTTSTINGFWDNGVACGGFVIGTDGICTLRTTNTSHILSGSNLRLHVVFNIEP